MNGQRTYHQHKKGSRRWGVLIYDAEPDWQIKTWSHRPSAENWARSEAQDGKDVALIRVTFVRQLKGKKQK